MTSAEYLKRPYARRLVPDESGGFVGTIQEFPGCVAEGMTADEALANLNAAAESWIDSVLALGQAVPSPIELHGYSGKIVLRMPRGLHKRVAETAASEGTSINQLLVTAVSSYLGEKRAFNIPAQSVVSQESWTNYFYPRLNQVRTGYGQVRIFDPAKLSRLEHVSPEQYAYSATLSAPFTGIKIKNLLTVTTKKLGATNG